MSAELSHSVFSIVTVGLNDREGFQSTRESIEAQTFADFEWIIVDGGSTDGTLQDLRSLTDRRYSWTSEPDDSHFDAMNKGLRRSQGAYVVFMNAGDAFADPEVLAKVDHQIKLHPGEWDLVFGDALERTARGALVLKRARSADAVTYGMFTHHQAIFYRRDAIGARQYDTTLYPIASDYEFTCQLFLQRRLSLKLGFPICIFNRGGRSETMAKVGRQDILAIQKQVLKLKSPRLILNHALFLLSAMLRRSMRGFYDWLRFSKPEA